MKFLQFTPPEPASDVPNQLCSLAIFHWFSGVFLALLCEIEVKLRLRASDCHSAQQEIEGTCLNLKYMDGTLFPSASNSNPAKGIPVVEVEQLAKSPTHNRMVFGQQNRDSLHKDLRFDSENLISVFSSLCASPCQAESGQ
ncbi:MAG: hypothetical protein ABR955_09760 [Verrucomicrobiota bacterium]|jgi:hypothetical protein